MKKIAIILAMMMVSAFSWGANQEPAPVPTALEIQGTPLVVIRFNQAHVYYEKPLFNAVQKAVQTDANVAFDVVSFVPQTDNIRNNKKINDLAQENTQRITDSLKHMGINPGNITLHNQPTPGLASHEVKIFVR